jgi:L-alanine-DL-glutamate epimerase-like enolase superfamily enzyme
MLDFNQSQSTAGAVERIRRLQDFDLTWVEEPIGYYKARGKAFEEELRDRRRTCALIWQRCQMQIL